MHQTRTRRKVELRDEGEGLAPQRLALLLLRPRSTIRPMNAAKTTTRRKSPKSPVDTVLLRMLNTPPTPHAAPKPTKRAKAKKRRVSAALGTDA